MGAVPPSLAAALGVHYLFERELGQGGMATVYLARDTKHDRLVAIKVLRPDLAASIGSQRFLREIQIAARLSHPHILPLLDSGEAEGVLYYVMPYVTGESLRTLLQRDGALPIETAVRLAREVADGLAYAHEQGIVHRDIKPENILLQSGHAIVSDFGIARAVSVAAEESSSEAALTSTGILLGTPLYMSPEQILGGPLDGRSDVYSLACVLYEMLSASPPFAGPGARAVLVAHASHSAPSVRERRREVPVALEEALFVALAKAPGERYASASGFRDALDVGTPSAASPHGRRAPSRVRRRWLAAAAIGVLGIGGAAAWLSAARRTSVALAVLPFVNQSSSADDQYFADGMTDELINALGRIPGFQVASRTSVYALREAHLDPAALSARLNANKLVEASVQRAAGELRVTARLINAKDGYVLWSQTYRRDLKNVFAVQDEIVRAIVGALAGRLAASSQTLLHHSTDNVDAYDEYLKGRYFWEQRFRGPDAMRRAVMHFERAIARDSSYAQAWAGLADVYSLQPGFGDVKPGDAFPKARAAALRALALDSTLAEAHTSLGIVSVFYDWNWAGAEREFDRALALDASESRSHLFHAWCLVGAGKYDAATEEIRTAQRLDPTSPIIGARLGTILMYTGHPDEGTRALRAALDLDSTNVAARGELILALALERKFTEALAIAPPPADLAAGFNGAAIMAFALGGAGRLSEARAQAQRLDEMSRTRYVTPEAFALTALALGDTARALDWLERGYREHSFFMLFTAIFPPYAPLRGSARYARIIEGMRLGTPIGGAGSAAKQPSTP